MPRTKISEFSSTPASNTDIDSINIAENCPPSGINDAIRELMSQLKDFQVGSAGDPVTVGGVLTVQAGAVGTPAITTAGDTNTGIFFPAADTIAFAEGGAEVARFDSSGNLGLGVTPSAWGVSGVLQSQNSGSYLFGGGTSWSSGNFMFLGNNGYYNGTNWIYSRTNAVSQYVQVNGEHRWQYAPSGTAGNAITFTQAMTLDASGNLLLGSTSSPSTVWSGSRTFAYVKGGTSGNGGEVIVESNNGNQQASFFASAITAEFGIWSTKASALLFGTNNAERARIDSSGNLLVGTTSQLQSSRLSVLGTGNIGDFRTSSASGYPVVCENTASGSTNMVVFLSGASTTTVGSITYNGSVTLFNTTSDQRLKENIQDADSASNLIDSLKVRKFDWKESNVHQRYGFVAQELVTVAPEAVNQPEDTEQMMAVDYSKLVPMLVKEIQSLRKRLADAGI